MQTNLKFLNSRQDVIAQNIANANVPGYKARDIKTPDFGKVMSEMGANKMSTSSVKLATTEPGHISGNTSFGDFRTVVNSTSEGEVTPSGNSVVLEDEVMKMSKTGLEYQQTTDLYRKMIEMIKTAIGNV